MKLTLAKDTLKEALDSVLPAIPTRAIKPVDSHILLVARDTQITITATNLMLTISRTIGARIHEEGACTIAAHLLADILATTTVQQIDLTLDGNSTLHLTTGHTRSKLKTLKAEDFPATPQIEPDTTIVVPANTLASLIRQVTYAAARDEARPSLTGTFFKYHEETLTLACPDGFRLAAPNEALPGNAPSAQLLSPAPTL